MPQFVSKSADSIHTHTRTHTRTHAQSGSIYSVRVQSHQRKANTNIKIYRFVHIERLRLLHHKDGLITNLKVKYVSAYTPATSHTHTIGVNEGPFTRSICDCFVSESQLQSHKMGMQPIQMRCHTLYTKMHRIHTT